MWDHHATITIRDGRFFIAPEGEALMLCAGRPFQGGVLRMDEDFSLGAARLTASLAPARQYNLAVHEALIAALIVAAVIGQTLLLAGLR